MTDYAALWHRLTTIYDVGEAQAIVRYVLDVRFGLSTADICCGKVTQLSADERLELEKIMDRLAKAEPVQYVLGKTEFNGRWFAVERGVLIPRPETEDLCRWVASSTEPSTDILDVGTGSGCIAVSLAKDIANAKVTAWDISTDALRIAAGNAKSLNANITFKEQNALNAPFDIELWDAVVSNPPYICDQEKVAMERNVLDYEPATALFVPDNDPLRFYKAIAEYAAHALKHGGQLFFEINPLYAGDIQRLLKSIGYIDITVKEDTYGKQRFTKATRP